MSENENKDKTELYFDGSLFNNGFKDGKVPYGGWAFIVVKNEEVIYEKSGGAFLVTNNQMEMRAFYESLVYIYELIKNNKKYEDHEFIIHGDSEYVIKSILFYCKKWILNDWKKTYDNTPVKNVEAWKELYDMFYNKLNNFHIQLNWVKGHANNIFHNIVDAKSREAANEYLLSHEDEYKEIEKTKKSNILKD